MVNRNEYARIYNEDAARQERIMQKQMRRALNAFILKYARIYQRSAANLVESLLKKEHQDRIEGILAKRYKFIIPHFSKFALDNFRDEITKAEADILINQQDELTQAYIQQFALAKSATIATTSVDKVKTRIDKGVRAGDSIGEIAGSIRSIQLINTSRAETIARTEVHGAANYAQLETAGKAEKEFNIKMVKEWVAVNDSRTRDPHANVDGQTVDKDANFNVNGEMMKRPLDPAASADNVINCRCAMIFRKKEYQIN